MRVYKYLHKNTHPISCILNLSPAIDSQPIEYKNITRNCEHLCICVLNCSRDHMKSMTNCMYPLYSVYKIHTTHEASTEFFFLLSLIMLFSSFSSLVCFALSPFTWILMCLRVSRCGSIYTYICVCMCVYACICCTDCNNRN